MLNKKKRESIKNENKFFETRGFNNHNFIY